MPAGTAYGAPNEPTRPAITPPVGARPCRARSGCHPMQSITAVVLGVLTIVA